MDNYWLNKRKQQRARLLKIALESKFDIAWVIDLADPSHKWHHVCLITEKDTSLSAYIDGVYQGQFRREDEEPLVEQ